MTESLTDYVKSFESIETSRSGVNGKPIIARLDGHCFSSFTKSLSKPYDTRLTNLMRDTTRKLVSETNALIGYTQSDEITLVWYLPKDHPGQYFFGVRFQKLAGILASKATGYFIREIDRRIPEKTGSFPEFDARVWQVPTLRDAGKTLLQREQDAIKNSITMLASSYFSHKQLLSVNGETKREMLRKMGDPWEDHPTYFRKGSYFRRQIEFRKLEESEMMNIPEQHRPTQPVERSIVREVFFEDLSKIKDLTSIFKIEM